MFPEYKANLLNNNLLHNIPNYSKLNVSLSHFLIIGELTTQSETFINFLIKLKNLFSKIIFKIFIFGIARFLKTDGVMNLLCLSNIKECHL